MKQGTESKLKFKKLKMRLQFPEWQVIGLLESIWKLTRSSAPEGDIGRHSNEDIAAGIEYSGDADELVGALIECGWLDEDPEFRLLVHDWSEHVPNYMKGNFAKHDKQFANEVAKQRPKQPPRQPSLEVTKHGATKPSQTRPIQTKPSQGESVSTDVLVPDRFDTEGVRSALATWHELVYERTGRPYSPVKLQDEFYQMAQSGSDAAKLERDIRFSIKNSTRYGRLLDSDEDFRSAGNGKRLPVEVPAVTADDLFGGSDDTG